jgi:hypothetical protein
VIHQKDAFFLQGIANQAKTIKADQFGQLLVSTPVEHSGDDEPMAPAPIHHFIPHFPEKPFGEVRLIRPHPLASTQFLPQYGCSPRHYPKITPAAENGKIIFARPIQLTCS